MSSQRLPGKPLLSIAGKPLLQRIVEQLRKSKEFTRIVIATTKNHADDPIAALARKLRVDLYRGSENDVLSRFVEIGRKYNADHVARICGDQPFNDVTLIDDIVRKHIFSQVDFTTTALKRTFPKGLDIELMNRVTLEKLDKSVKKSDEKEHVTLHIVRRPSKFKIQNIEAHEQIRRPEIVFTIDSASDLHFVRKVYSAIPKWSSITKVIQTVDKQKIIRRPLVVFRADGGHLRGMGHIYSTVMLAQELQKQRNCEVIFLTKKDKAAEKKIREAGFDIIYMPGGNRGFDSAQDAKWIIKTLSELRPELYVTDVLDSKLDYAPALRALKIRTAAMDVPGVTKFRPDIVINRSAIPERLAGYKRKSGESTFYTGAQYVMLAPQYVKTPKKKIARSIRRILVTFGGSDVKEDTPRVLRALTQSNCSKAEIIVVVGPAYGKKIVRLKNTIKELPIKVRLVQDAKNMASLMREADFAIATAGRTLYELAASGTPALVICVEPEQPRNAREFESHGTIVDLGWSKDISVSKLAKEIDNFANDYRKRYSMSASGRKMVDGKGTSRIVELMLNLLDSQI